MKLSKRFPQSERKAVKAHIAYELSQLLGSNYSDQSGPLPLEITNTFLIGLMVDPISFCEQSTAREVIENVLSGNHVGYFATLCALHYMNSVQPADLVHNDQLHEMAIRDAFGPVTLEFLAGESCDLRINAEHYLVFCDFLSCKAVDQTMRWEAFRSKLGVTEISKAKFEELMVRLRHTNWSEPGHEFELLIKRLPPVYFA